jgi:hypothetical protein
MENDERAEMASRDVRHTHDKLSVGFAVRDELARGTDKQRSSAFEALADEAYEEAMDILDQSPSILVPVRPCPVVCELTLRHEVQDVQDLCQWVLQAVLKGFEHAGLIEDFDGFLELNSEIHVVPQVGDTNEFRFDFVVERVYETARARVARKRRHLGKSRRADIPAESSQVAPVDFRIIGFAIVATAILAVVGSFLPWAEALGGALRRNGTDGDGIITLVVALIGGGLGLGLAFTRKDIVAYLAGLGGFLCGALIGGVAGYDLKNLTDVIGDIERESSLDLGLSAGSGLYLTLVAGIAMALAGILAILAAAYRVVKG